MALKNESKAEGGREACAKKTRKDGKNRNGHSVDETILYGW